MSTFEAVILKSGSCAHQTLIARLMAGALLRPVAKMNAFELHDGQVRKPIDPRVVATLKNNGWIEMDLLGDYRIDQRHLPQNPQ